MKVQILSDLHLEHGGAVSAHQREADVIVLAGDLAPWAMWIDKDGRYAVQVRGRKADRSFVWSQRQTGW